MKNIIIGAGASGIYAAILLKRKYINDEVLLIEHSDKPLKKILATGNGKCNLGNANLDVNNYSNNSFVKPLLNDFPFEKQREFYASIGIETKLINNLLYPYSESSSNVRDALLNTCRKLKIKININENVVDYKNGELITDIRSYHYDRLIFATGGKSLPKSGSDGGIISLLKQHNYQINDFVPALCPIKTKENTKDINGLRVKAKASLYKEDKLLYIESGEVLFKDHGLSGIVIMNLSRLIAKEKGNYCIKLDLIEDVTYEKLNKQIKIYSEKELLNRYVHKDIAQYFIDNNIPAKNIKQLTFHFEQLSTFDISQLSVGGILVNQLKANLESKIEKNVYFIGELVDVDGPCGGYNLTWALICANAIK